MYHIQLEGETIEQLLKAVQASATQLETMLGTLTRTGIVSMKRGRPVGSGKGKKHTHWSKEEDQYIIDNFRNRKARAIGRELKRTSKAVTSRARQLRKIGTLTYRKHRWGEAKIVTSAPSLSTLGSKIPIYASNS